MAKVKWFYWPAYRAPSMSAPLLGVTSMLKLADRFAEKWDLRREDVVVFYPRGYDRVLQVELLKKKKNPNIKDKYRGLTLCRFPGSIGWRPRQILAFSIEHVAMERTPANPRFLIWDVRNRTKSPRVALLAQ